jgi:predicted nucleotidyltransferase
MLLAKAFVQRWKVFPPAKRKLQAMIAECQQRQWVFGSYARKEGRAYVRK